MKILVYRRTEVDKLAYASLRKNTENNGDIMKTCKTISVANQKGGEGKTTTAINLAHGLALKDYKTLVVDMDPQGNTSSIFIDTESLEPTVANLFQNKIPVKEIIQPTQYQNLFVLPSKINLAEVELSLLNVEAPYALRDGLSAILPEFEVIVIDCPPSLSIFTINALVASHYVIVPLQAEKFSVDGIKGLQNTIEGIKRRINPDLEIMGALITQLRSNTVLSQTVLPVIQNYFAVFETMISSGVAVGESHLSKKSLFDYSPNIKQTKEYQLFVNEVDNVLKE